MYIESFDEKSLFVYISVVLFDTTLIYMVLPVFFVHTCEQQMELMYAERGPRITDVNTLSIITLQNIDPDVRNESRKQSCIVFMYM